MTSNTPQGRMTSTTPQAPIFGGNREPSPQNLADVLERVLDKGIVVVGDIQVRLLDIELLTIKIRLMVASVDRAREMGISWWEGDPFLSPTEDGDSKELEDRVRELEQRLDGNGAASRGR
jgi:hypothetical protein